MSTNSMGNPLLHYTCWTTLVLDYTCSLTLLAILNSGTARARSLFSYLWLLHWDHKLTFHKQFRVIYNRRILDIFAAKNNGSGFSSVGLRCSAGTMSSCLKSLLPLNLIQILFVSSSTLNDVNGRGSPLEIIHGEAHWWAPAQWIVSSKWWVSLFSAGFLQQY